MEYTNKGTSIISRKAAEERRRHFFKQKSYWEQLEKKKGNHQYVRNALLDMNELSGESLIMPRLLEQFFFLYYRYTLYIPCVRHSSDVGVFLCISIFMFIIISTLSLNSSILSTTWNSIDFLPSISCVSKSSDQVCILPFK